MNRLGFNLSTHTNEMQRDKSNVTSKSYVVDPRQAYLTTKLEEEANFLMTKKNKSYQNTHDVTNKSDILINIKDMLKQRNDDYQPVEQLLKLK